MGRAGCGIRWLEAWCDCCGRLLSSASGADSRTRPMGRRSPQALPLGLPAMESANIPVRWADMDAYQHVNNAVYLNYLEEARDKVMEKLFGEQAYDFVTARVEIDFRNEITQADGEVTVRSRVTGYGRSSVRSREVIVKGRWHGGSGGGCRCRPARHRQQAARAHYATTSGPASTPK